MKPKLIYTTFVASISIAFGAFVTHQLQPKQEPIIIKENVVKYIKTPCTSESVLIKSYMKTFHHLSKQRIDDISSHIAATGKKYNLNPLLLTAVIAKESSFRSWIRHSTVVVKVPLDKEEKKHKTMKTYAIGLTGVIWEVHKYRLIDAGITKKSDLYSASASIEAMAVVLNYYAQMKPLKGKSSLESAIIRYYGVTYNKGKIDTKYLGYIQNKIGEILSPDIMKDK